jgi:hypothetical protein
VTTETDLEQGYRRLLAWYPRAFRHESGPELLAVLLACAPDGRRRPGLAESANLIRHGLRMRLCPSVPRSARTVRAAVRLMYAGAAISSLYLINQLYLIMALASIDNNKLHHSTLPELTGMIQVPPLKPLAVAESVIASLTVIGLWLWLARATSRRRTWARIAVTALFGLTTLTIGLVAGAPRLAIDLGDWQLLALTWPVGAAAWCLLWLPASGAFFRPHRETSVVDPSSVSPHKTGE